MSRIGRMPITVPAGVDVKIGEGNAVTVKGPKGTLSQQLHPEMKIEMNAGEINIVRPSEQKKHKALHGLTRSLLANMVTGVTEGFQKELEINGVGYRAQMQGKKLVLNLGYSHPVEMDEVPGIEIEVPAPNKIIVRGADKQLVGHVAANIREKRLPEPYKGKGIKYATEHIRRKEGKAGKAKG
ncbi:MAG: 50S ribosomal protein L6 [Clostridia bacterium]|nr:50S ribosomal protein L6 [Oscillospiraceae bacterium]MBQ7032784.1 50S ribosomal protein L6 [Clostridia bacterium]